MPTALFSLEQTPYQVNTLVPGDRATDKRSPGNFVTSIKFFPGKDINENSSSHNADYAKNPPLARLALASGILPARYST